MWHLHRTLLVGAATAAILLPLACAKDNATRGWAADGASNGALARRSIDGSKDERIELDTGARLDIPEGAVDSKVEVSMERPPDADARELAKRFPEEKRIASAPYILKPHGQTFTKEATLTLPIAKEQQEKDMALAWLDDEDDREWKTAEAPKGNGQTATVGIKHFSVVMLVVARGDEPALDQDAGVTQDAGPDEEIANTGSNDAGIDAGTDAALVLPTLMCGSVTCEGFLLQQTVVKPCCLLETDACGVDADDIKRASPASPFTGCLPKDVPFASESVYCGAFFDQIEPDGDHENGGLDIKSGSRFAIYEGCCLPTGECGANITVQRGADPELNQHLGCVSYERVRDAFEADGTGELPTAEHLPFCDPANGEPPTSGTVPGVPASMCGCGEGNVDDGSGTCLSNLPRAVCGRGD